MSLKIQESMEGVKGALASMRQDVITHHHNLDTLVEDLRTQVGQVERVSLDITTRIQRLSPSGSGVTQDQVSEIIRQATEEIKAALTLSSSAIGGDMSRDLSVRLDDQAATLQEMTRNAHHRHETMLQVLGHLQGSVSEVASAVQDTHQRVEEMRAMLTLLLW
jgi:hypothetical protein